MRISLSGLDNWIFLADINKKPPISAIIATRATERARKRFSYNWRKSNESCLHTISVKYYLKVDEWRNNLSAGTFKWMQCGLNSRPSKYRKTAFFPTFHGPGMHPREKFYKNFFA